MASRLLSLALGLSALAAPARAADGDVDCTGVKAISPLCASAETAYRRDFFYVGGEAVATAAGNITAGQLYVEKLSPVGGATRPHPLVFFHGGGFAGTTWLNTPDNRPGFASYFVGQGYHVYLVDFNSVGRSAAVDPGAFPAAGMTSVEGLERGFTAVGALGAYPQARLHTQWPGTGRQGDAAFEQFRREPLPYTSNTTALETAVRRSGCALLALLGVPAYLVNHSMGGTAGILLSNDCPDLVAANVNLESATVPFSWPNVGLGSVRTRAWGLTSTPLAYDPPVADPAADLVVVARGNETLARRSCYRQAEPARRLPNVAAVPYLLLTGEASVHITFDHCIVDYLEQAGARPEWIKLADRGITGNGHFMHVELNNLEIAKVVQDWMESKGN